MEENLKQLQFPGTDIIKIAIYGPESTGKTTLSNQLADHFKTEWAPEFARDYLQQKWDSKKEICTPEDLLPIADGQMKLENGALQKAKNYLFVDTCLMATKVFSEIYYGFCDYKLDKAARKHKYDLFFLTDIDVPWEKDDLRDSPKERKITFEKFKQALIENNKPFIVLTGNLEIRFQKALAIIEGLTKAKQLGFSSQDFLQILDSEVPITEIEKQLSIYKNGLAKANLNRPALINDGILKLNEEEFQHFSKLFDSKKDNFKLKKFIPASGAASRMFKFLNEFLNEFNIENETINAYINRKNATELIVFLAGMEKFPFFKSIDNKLSEEFHDFKSWNKDQQNYHFIKWLLDEDHFDFSNKPKGVLPFHQYQNDIATPIEEHLKESVLYSCANGISNLHFTVSETHKLQFENTLENVKRKIEEASEIKINISFSHQHKYTDSIAVGFDNKPFRNHNGELVFRPGGHGALIENLNSLDADIVFIKNIDNVILNEAETIAFYKKSLAGILIELQEKVNSYLLKIDSISENEIAVLVNFVEQQLNNKVNLDFSKYTLENKISNLKEILNRPIRVCGMVKNEGEPGGGPFWVTDWNGNTTLQIVESAQIDFSNAKQALIASNATHFNPVDLVCGLKDYKGSKFDYKNFMDYNSGFIVEKNKLGKPIKGYELPGLWNGAMSNWITIFVEVPLITFNPVKTVNDLLKPAHQNH
jgi:nicotinamide riboside kinase